MFWNTARPLDIASTSEPLAAGRHLKPSACQGSTRPGQGMTRKTRYRFAQLLLGPNRPHKHRDPTNHAFWYPPYIGPWNQNVLMFMWSFGALCLWVSIASQGVRDPPARIQKVDPAILDCRTPMVYIDYRTPRWIYYFLDPPRGLDHLRWQGPVCGLANHL